MREPTKLDHAPPDDASDDGVKWKFWAPRLHSAHLEIGLVTIWETPEGVFWYGAKLARTNAYAGPAQRGTRLTLDEAKRAGLEALRCEHERRVRRGGLQ